MIKGHPHICLYRPEIPQNAGNIGRLAAATQTRLHMVQPFGFSTDDKNLRRSGLDYWPFLDLEVHKNEEKLFEKFKDRMAFFSKFATKAYYEMPIETDLLIFGQETKGLPEEFVTKYADSFYKIPMYHQGVRSLNLANSVAIVTYDLIRRRTEAAKS